MHGLFYRQLGVVLGVKCCLLDNAQPSATTVDGFLWDRPNGLMKRIVEIVGQNPGGDITFHWLNENLTVKGKFFCILYILPYMILV